MFKIHKEELEVNGKKLTLETGKVARQADGAIIATLGETVVIATAVVSKYIANVFIPILPIFFGSLSPVTPTTNEEKMSGTISILIENINKNNKRGSTEIVPVVETHPIRGGIAPAAPPITMF